LRRRLNMSIPFVHFLVDSSTQRRMNYLPILCGHQI
jgi:hypothetical protein